MLDWCIPLSPWIRALCFQVKCLKAYFNHLVPFHVGGTLTLYVKQSERFFCFYCCSVEMSSLENESWWFSHLMAGHVPLQQLHSIDKWKINKRQFILHTRHMLIVFSAVFITRAETNISRYLQFGLSWPKYWQVCYSISRGSTNEWNLCESLLIDVGSILWLKWCWLKGHRLIHRYEVIINRLYRNNCNSCC